MHASNSLLCRLARVARGVAILQAAILQAAGGLQAAPLDADGRLFAEPRAGADTPSAREYRAGIQAQLKGDRAAAKLRFEAALRLDPQSAPALIGLAGVAQAQGHPEQVEAFLQRAEKVAPQSAEVHLAWGRYFLGGRQIARAETSFNTARALAPKAIPPLLDLGEIYIRQPGRNAEALRVYRDAVALDSQNVFAHYGLGVAAAAAGQPDDALRAFEQAAALAPQDPAPLRAAGRLHLESGALDKALAAFDRGLARQPKFVPLMLDRSDALARQARWSDAAAQLQAAEKLAPKAAEVALKQGDVYQGAARWGEARSSYLKAIELEPRNPVPYNNLAWMTVLRNGEAGKAVELARKAVELSPNSSPFHDTLGWAERAAGNLPGALRSLQRAIELEPRVGGYHFHLGVVQGELKQAAAARASLQRALELDSKLPQADEARRLIKQMAG